MWGLMGGTPPPSFSLGVVGRNPPSSFPPVVWGLVGGKGFPPSPPLVWGLVSGNPPPSPLWCRVWWSRGGLVEVVKLLYMRQTIFCGRRFCSETSECPFKCFGRPWRFLLGTIQYRAIKSVLTTSRPPIIDYTLCHILYTIFSRVYTIYYRLYSVYMVYLHTIARPLKGGNQVLHTSLRAMREPDYSILQHTIVKCIILQCTIVYYSIL